MTISNPLISAAKFLKRTAEAHPSSYAFADLLDTADTNSTLAKAWACSAVLLKNGDWNVVPSNDYAKVVSGSLQVKVFGGGTLSGRNNWRGSGWLETEVDKVWLGALLLPGGSGAAAVFETPSGRQTIKVTPADSPTTDGQWPTWLQRGDDDPVQLSLEEALKEAGAVPVTRERAERAETPPKMVSLGDPALATGERRAAARALTKNLFTIGATTVDSVNGEMSGEELAAVLYAAVDLDAYKVDGSAAQAAAELLCDPVAGAAARAGVARRLAEAWGELGEEAAARLRQTAKAFLSAVALDVQRGWPPGAGVAMAVEHAVDELNDEARLSAPADGAQPRRQLAPPHPTGGGAEPSGADAHRKSKRSRAGGGAAQQPRPPAGASATRAARGSSRAIVPIGEADGEEAAGLDKAAEGAAGGDSGGSDSESSLTDSADEQAALDGADSGGGGGGEEPIGALLLLVPDGESRGLGARTALAAVAYGGRGAGLATPADAAAKLTAVRCMLAELNGKRELFAEVAPHASEAAAADTREDMAALLAEARTLRLPDGTPWKPQRPATWGSAMGALTRLAQAVHAVRRSQAAAGAPAPALKLPKDATVKVEVVAEPKPNSNSRDFARAAAAGVLAPLTDVGLVLREARAVRDGERLGGPLQAAAKAVRAHGQPLKALLLSNGRSRSEVAGAGISAALSGYQEAIRTWLQGRLSTVVGEYKEAEAGPALGAAARALQCCDVDEAQLRELVRLLAGKPRTKAWRASERGAGNGSWGDASNPEHVVEAAGALARILKPLLADVIGMDAGLAAGEEEREAFGLRALAVEATDDLTTDNAIVALRVAFEALARKAERLRSDASARPPCLLQSVQLVRREVLADMGAAERTDARVDERVAATLAELGIRQGGGGPAGGGGGGGGVTPKPAPGQQEETAKTLKNKARRLKGWLRKSPNSPQAAKWRTMLQETEARLAKVGGGGGAGGGGGGGGRGGGQGGGRRAARAVARAGRGGRGSDGARDAAAEGEPARAARPRPRPRPSSRAARPRARARAATFAASLFP